MRRGGGWPRCGAALERARREGLPVRHDKASAKNLFNLERSLLCLTNVHRIQNGRRAAAARHAARPGRPRAHSADMAARGFFDHTNPEGLDPSARAVGRRLSRPAGENIATTADGTVFALFELWRTSTAATTRTCSTPRYKAAGFGVDPTAAPRGPGGHRHADVRLRRGRHRGRRARSLRQLDSCAKAKLSLINLRKALKKAKEKGSSRVSGAEDGKGRSEQGQPALAVGADPSARPARPLGMGQRGPRR